jgi:hypothetical protein
MKMYVLRRAYMKMMSAQSIDEDALVTMQMGVRSMVRMMEF